MKAAPFAYHRAESVDEAVALLGEYGDEAKILAGGQSLVPMLAMRLTRFENLIDISRLGELTSIDRRNGDVRIGATTPDVFVGLDDEVADAVPLLTLATACRSGGGVRRGGARARREHGGGVAAGLAPDRRGGVLHRAVGDLAGSR